MLERCGEAASRMHLGSSLTRPGQEPGGGEDRRGAAPTLYSETCGVTVGGAT